jgi:hypothetical protein
VSTNPTVNQSHFGQLLQLTRLERSLSQREAARRLANIVPPSALGTVVAPSITARWWRQLEASASVSSFPHARELVEHVCEALSCDPEGRGLLLAASQVFTASEIIAAVTGRRVPDPATVVLIGLCPDGATDGGTEAPLHQHRWRVVRRLTPHQATRALAPLKEAFRVWVDLSTR